MNKTIWYAVYVFFASLLLMVGYLMVTSGSVNAQEFSVRGRLHLDAFYGINDADNFSNGFNNRRARMGMGGTVTENWDGRIEVDFADGGVSPNDFRLRRSFPHGGRLWMGQFKVPQGLNQLTSSNQFTFIERSMINNIIADARRLGMAYELNKGLLGFKTMVFGRALGQRGALESDMPIGGALRGYYFPQIGEGQLHIGASGVYEELFSNKGVSFSDRPESRDSKGGSVRLIRANVPDAVSTFKLGGELLYINGPFSIEGEYQQVTVNNSKGANPTFFGWVVQTSYVLTGESRSYRNGALGGISPKGENGAWEIALRYSYMNLNDKDFDGGEQSNITFGLNRYVTSRLRFMGNIVYVNLDYTDDNPLLGVVRAQYNF